jgi:hypothetical protein
MSGESSCSGQNNNAAPYDYGDKKPDSGKAPKFNADPNEFSWWKTNMYSYIMGLDEELWDILEEGVDDLILDEERAVVDRKKHISAQYELFKMKDDESIEEMYSTFQTPVSGLQILKKSYVASDHVSKILRSLPVRWRPTVTSIEEAKDLNTLSVEDLVISLKVHEMSLNEHESSKKNKSIAFPSNGKRSKALKVTES